MPGPFGRMKNTDFKAIVAQAMDIVYTDFDKYVKAQAQEHTIANLGQDLEHCAREQHVTNPEKLVDYAYGYVYQIHGEELGEDGAEDCVAAELKYWMKEARKNCMAVKKAKLPWTLRNSRDCFERRGHFAVEKNTNG